MKILCDIYKSKKQEELYLYIDKLKGLEHVPSQLLEKINTEKIVLSLVLTPERKLARADINKVLGEIQSKGYYLQMPPLPHTETPNTDD